MLAEPMVDSGDVLCFGTFRLCLRRRLLESDAGLAGAAVVQLRVAGRQTDLGWALTNLATYLLISGRSEEAALASAEALNLVQPAGGFILRVWLLQWALLAASINHLIGAARLNGFVEDGYKKAGEMMQPTEQRLHDRLHPGC